MMNIITETLVALANTNGGTCAVPPDVDVRPLAAMCQPAVPLGRIEAVNGHYQVEVLRSVTMHALPDGRVMGRWNDQNHELSSVQIRRLARLKSLGDFENEAVPGAHINDFDPDLHDQLGPDDLFAMGAINEQQNPTVAGILLLSSHPERWLPQAQITVSILMGQNRIVTQHQLRGPISQLMGTTWSYLEPFVSGFPATAIREALANALVHRSYRLAAPISIKVYPDRFEIHSPGDMPGYADNLLQQDFYRNPKIVNNLCQWRYIRGQRSGIARIKQAMSNAQLPQPILRLQHDNLVLTLRKAHAQPESVTIALNWRQQQAMTYIQEHGSITYRAFCALCNDSDPPILHHDLMTLVEQGLLKQVGNVFIRREN